MNNDIKAKIYNHDLLRSGIHQLAAIVMCHLPVKLLKFIKKKKITQPFAGNLFGVTRIVHA